MAGIAGVVLAIVLSPSGLMEAWEAKTWDWRVGVMAEPGMATKDIVLILLDQNSLDWAKEVNGLAWPWPREVYGAIVNFCRRSGARALALDVLFTEPSKYGVEDDAAFAQAISDYGRVALATFLSNQSGNDSSWPAAVPRPVFTVLGAEGQQPIEANPIHTFTRASIPVEGIARQAAVLCNVSLSPDPDGIFRKVDLLKVFDDQWVPSLGLGVLLAANPETTLAFAPHHLQVGKIDIPIDTKGRTILRYRGPSGTHKTYSAAAVLQSEIQILNGERPNINDPNAFRDKYVLFGFSAPGLFDLRPSPISGVYAGVEIYATLIDNVLSGDLMRHPPHWAVLVPLVILSLICAVSLSLLQSVVISISAISLFISLPVLLAFGAYLKGFWLPIVVPEVAIALTVGLVLMINYTTEGRQKRFIKKAFKHFLSPAVIDQLIANPDRLRLGGERRVISIFFSDLQGFTTISERLDPESLIALLNDYLTEMTNIIHEEGGTIDKYEGDAIIAFWNAPLEISDHAVKAVKAALRCQERLTQMRPVYHERTGALLRMRIGINTGSAVVGNLGSNTRFDYTMIGDAVNLAARLEGANKQFGTFTMISQSTYELVDQQFKTRELARLTVVGRNAPVTVYEPMMPAAYEANQKVLETFCRGLSAFYQGRIDLGEKFFAEIEDRDPAALAYAEKCRAIVKEKPKDWQGVWVMGTK
ncbi:CHASE2 domain-containing protein [Desulfosarcina sp.]|uniref:CHASE2 domain-containing protein n=1 Tax=Desulfosarcina sp. TaxID=2027861 RepID=UPI00356689CA